MTVDLQVSYSTCFDDPDALSSAQGTGTGFLARIPGNAAGARFAHLPPRLRTTWQSYHRKFHVTDLVEKEGGVNRVRSVPWHALPFRSVVLCVGLCYVFFLLCLVVFVLLCFVFFFIVFLFCIVLLCIEVWVLGFGLCCVVSCYVVLLYCTFLRFFLLCCVLFTASRMLGNRHLSPARMKTISPFDPIITTVWSIWRYFCCGIDGEPGHFFVPRPGGSAL